MSFIGDLANIGVEATSDSPEENARNISKAESNAAFEIANTLVTTRSELAALEARMAALVAAKAAAPSTDYAAQIKAKQDRLDAIQNEENIRQGGTFRTVLNRYTPAHKEERAKLLQDIEALRAADKKAGKNDPKAGQPANNSAKAIADLQADIDKKKYKIELSEVALAKYRGEPSAYAKQLQQDALDAARAQGGSVTVMSAPGAGDAAGVTVPGPITSQPGLPWGWILAGAGLLGILFFSRKSK